MRMCVTVTAICLACEGILSAADQAQAVPTFHCVGLYWSPDGGSAEDMCHVRYRPAGTQEWREALPLWFDGREAQEALPSEHSRQYRGSIVNLSPGREYEVELSLEKTGQRTSVRARTWSERFPVADRIFVFHNTILQPTQIVDGAKTRAGARLGLGWGGPMVNVTSRNNILHAWSVAISDRAKDLLGDYDHDLYSGPLRAAEGHEHHGIKGEPAHVGDVGLKDGKGRFELVPASPGYDAGLRLPNFNDGLTGSGPDLGAHEAGTPAMRFGVEAPSTGQ